MKSKEDLFLEGKITAGELLDDDAIIIAEFDFDDVFTESSFKSSLKGMGKCTIEINMREGDNVPHFHLKSSNGFNGCIKIFEPEAFSHGKYKDEITDGKTKKELNKFLNSKLDKRYDQTVWEVIRDEWLESHKQHQYPAEYYNMSQPDYSKM